MPMSNASPGGALGAATQDSRHAGRAERISERFKCQNGLSGCREFDSGLAAGCSLTWRSAEPGCFNHGVCDGPDSAMS